MIKKNKFFGLFIFSLLGACTAPTAMIAPAYTLTSSGNVIQASLNYGTNQVVTNYTGKSTIESLKEVSQIKKLKKKNIKKKTLESEEFHILVKSNIEKTSGVLDLTNQ
ncbi:hypothetical protein OAN68_01700 [Candidatus Pelagibacter sp.]|nr:hypothetical protein [Candidatus Pelagibacter sp.]